MWWCPLDTSQNHPGSPAVAVKLRRRTTAVLSFASRLQQDWGRGTAGPLFWLAIVTFAICLGWSIVSPVLPLYGKAFGVGTFAICVLVASFSMTNFVFDPYGDRLADRYGARHMACRGAMMVAVASVVAGAAPDVIPRCTLRRSCRPASGRRSPSCCRRPVCRRRTSTRPSRTGSGGRRSGGCCLQRRR